MDLKSKGLQPIVEDRISALPDALRCHILSFLETKYAVRTSILSKRWKNIWASVTSLRFLNLIHRNDFGFNSFVNRVLLFRNSLDIQKFRLHCYCIDENLADIDTWICTAVRRNVVELDLSISGCLVDSTFQLPKCFFTCKTLVVLKVCSNFLTCCPPTSGCFPCLKLLEVTAHSTTTREAIGNLVSHCPVLEHLIIDHHGLYPLSDLHISAPKLMSLKISLADKWCNIFIKSPKLENLDISEITSPNLGGTFSKYYLDNPKSLVKANIDLKCRDSETPAFDSRGRFMAKISGKRVNVLLAEISGVKDLSLSAPCREACELPAFDNLNKLKLYDWEPLAVFLNASPNLEDLVLEIGTKSDEEYIEHQWIRQSLCLNVCCHT